MKGEVDRFNELDLEQAADEYFDPTLVLQIAQAFGSPGGYIARLVGSAAAIVLGSVVMAAVSDESQPIDSIQTRSQVEVTAVGANGDLPSEDVQRLSRSLRAGRADELRQKYGRAARDKLGLSVSGERSPELTAPDRITPE